jgi:hypothetical protein
MVGHLKLATKYQVDALRSQIIKHLKWDWPSTIDDWDRVDDDTHKKRSAALQSSDGSLDGVVPDPVYAILLARSCDVPQILPTAFYVLSRQPTKPKIRPAESSKAHIHSRTLLDMDDMENLALGRENIAEKIGSYELLDIDNWHCADVCEGYIWTVWGEFLLGMIVDKDPLRVLLSELRCLRNSSPEYGLNLCVICQRTMANNIVDARSTLFNSLSDMFGLV